MIQKCSKLEHKTSLAMFFTDLIEGKLMILCRRLQEIKASEEFGFHLRDLESALKASIASETRNMQSCHVAGT